MKVTFTIDYHTNWGEALFISGETDALGAGDRDKAVALRPVGDSKWSVTVDILQTAPDFSYRYFVRHEHGGIVAEEWGKTPHIYHRSSDDTPVVNRHDLWQDTPMDKPYYSSVVIDTINRRESRKRISRPRNGMVTISVDAPMVAPDQVVAIAGAPDALGAWNPKKAPVMNDAGFPTWTINIPASELPRYVEFKFFIRTKESAVPIAWENCDNRTIELPAKALLTLNCYTGLRLADPFPPMRAAGVAIPVFSVRTDEDFGVGDFFDLKKMVDWAVETGQKFLQILPINDTTMTGTWIDSYPYNANSSFALHPMFLRLEEVGKLENPARQDHYEAIRHELNSLPEIDYERVNRTKAAYTREIFLQNGAKVLQSKEYRKFIADNSHWLLPYAAFCVLRDHFGTPDFTLWEEYSVFDKAKIEKFSKENKNEIDYVCFIQYHLDRQMREVSEYARAHGVAFKGDIPIGVSRTSVDAWQYPELFYMNTSAGAPPDDFSILGQNWGFPTYNWEKMGLDGFAWWKARFRKMAEYFDAYRIDHVLGFFRIWQIPQDAIHGLLGIFHPALPFTPEELRTSYDFWIDTDTMTTPLIMDWFIHDLFGDCTEEVKSAFLCDAGSGRWKLRPEFDTQKKVAEYFARQEKNEQNETICNALLNVIDNVLFIEDPDEHGKYHPRISAQSTFAYRSLNDYQRWCYDRLYNDFFYHRHNSFWHDNAMWKLPPIIDATDMLTCAEDLGMIPHCVPAVMDTLRILSLEIQRMPKDPHCEFGDTTRYPYLSVCTTSTHDMSGIRGWWEENREKPAHFYHNVLRQNGDVPYFAEPWICDRIVDMNLKAPSMLCILPLQDWMSISSDLRRNDPRDEQINIPANSRHYWRYRMHITVERLLASHDFNSRVKQLIRGSGR